MECPDIAVLRAGPLIERVGLSYRFMWRDDIRLAIDRLHESRGELSGELTVRQGGEHLYRGKFNASSITARKSTATYLRERAGDQGWLAVLERFCVELLDAYRLGEEVEYVGDLPVTERRLMLLDPILARDEATILFGLGDLGKSTLLAAFAVAIETGITVVTGMAPQAARVMVLDYESTAADWTRESGRSRPAPGSRMPRGLPTAAASTRSPTRCRFSRSSARSMASSASSSTRCLVRLVRAGKAATPPRARTASSTQRAPSAGRGAWLTTCRRQRRAPTTPGHTAAS